MFETLKKMGLVGIGALAMAEDEAKAVVADLRKRGELNEEEGRKVLQELSERLAGRRQEVKEMVAETVNEAMKELNLPSRAEFDDLAKRVEKLEAAAEAKKKG